MLKRLVLGTEEAENFIVYCFIQIFPMLLKYICKHNIFEKSIIV